MTIIILLTTQQTFTCLTLSRRRPLSYRSQSTDLLHKSMDWFLYDIGLRPERVKTNNRKTKKVCEICSKLTITTPELRKFEVNKRNTKNRCEICSKLTIRIPERRSQWRRSGVFFVNFELISYLFAGIFIVDFE